MQARVRPSALRAPLPAPLPRRSFFAPGPRPADILLLAGTTWCAAALAIFVGAASGAIPWVDPFAAAAWHAHELIFGATGAVIAGFLLSAIPNWVGRRPVGGAALALIFILWLAGRAAMLARAQVGATTAAAVDILFLLALVTVLLREVRRGIGGRSARVVVLAAAFAAVDIGFHAEWILHGGPGASARAAVAVVVAMIIVIGGRMIPAFTHDALVRRGETSHPAAFGRIDAAALGLAGVALMLWIVRPASPLTAVTAVIAGAAQIARLARWRGWRTGAEPLLAVLHLAYAFVAGGFLLLGLGPADSALHAWTAGAMGLMMLGVMARGALGHAGRGTAAGAAVAAILAAGFVAAGTRIAAPIAGRFEDAALLVSAACWIAAYGSFSAWLALWLLRARRARA